jgi:exosortase
VPIPAVVYNRITFPLQILASEVATVSLDFLGIPVLREGNVLHLADTSLSVVEACSGIRSLLSLTFLSLVYGFFFESRIWIRVALFLATVPIAIVANAGRVTLTGLLSEYKPELAEGLFHTASGWVIFMIALAVLLAFHQGIRLGLKVIDVRKK